MAFQRELNIIRECNEMCPYSVRCINLHPGTLGPHPPLPCFMQRVHPSDIKIKDVYPMFEAGFSCPQVQNALMYYYLIHGGYAGATAEILINYLLDLQVS